MYLRALFSLLPLLATSSLLPSASCASSHRPRHSARSPSSPLADSSSYPVNGIASQSDLGSADSFVLETVLPNPEVLAQPLYGRSTLEDRARLLAAGEAAAQVERAMVGFQQETIGTRRDRLDLEARAGLDDLHLRLGLAAAHRERQQGAKRSSSVGLGGDRHARRLVRRTKAPTQEGLELRKRQAAAQCALQPSGSASPSASASGTSAPSSSNVASVSSPSTSSTTAAQSHSSSASTPKPTTAAPTTSKAANTPSVSSSKTTSTFSAPSASASAPVTTDPGAADPFGPGPYSGWATYFDVGLSACGTYDTAADPIVAISAELFDEWPGAGENPNLNPICGRHLEITWGGKSLVAEVTDRCPGCAVRSLDLSLGAFEHFADTSVGLLGMDSYTGNITWKWVDGTGRLPTVPVNWDGSSTT